MIWQKCRQITKNCCCFAKNKDKINVREFELNKIIKIRDYKKIAKKFEITRDDECGAGVPDVDIVITTNELAKMLKDAEIQLEAMNPNAKFDVPLGIGTGAAVIFGVTGGVMEAALRTAVETLTGQDAVVEYTTVRGMNGIKEASVDVNGTTVKVAVVSGLANANQLLTAIQKWYSRLSVCGSNGLPGWLCKRWRTAASGCCNQSDE